MDIVLIGNQEWANSNLNVDKFSNGDIINEVKSSDEWMNCAKNSQPAWCYYENDSSNDIKYGKLYNWFAVNDPRGLAPEGWHIPSDDEWTILSDFLKTSVGKKMKSSEGWKDDGNGTNKCKFTALPGGLRGNYGAFVAEGGNGYWWSNTKLGHDHAWSRNLGFLRGTLGRDYSSFDTGMSVRCLKSIQY
jgi:uncharacterized protein (TIGR02145 family)